MKSDILNELKKEFQKLNKHRNKVAFLIISFMTCISIIFVLLVLKSKSKNKKSLEQDFEQDEFYEDYYALDYEE